eukprot:12880055-Prorocentrum_lima.AAC.1
MHVRSRGRHIISAINGVGQGNDVGTNSRLPASMAIVQEEGGADGGVLGAKQLQQKHEPHLADNGSRAGQP